jgi:hypothetical protein
MRFFKLGVAGNSRLFHLMKFKTGGLDALVVWWQIRSITKGSIEYVKEGGPLAEHEYLKMGENRCRISNAQRQQAYDNVNKPILLISRMMNVYPMKECGAIVIKSRL